MYIAKPNDIAEKLRDTYKKLKRQYPDPKFKFTESHAQKYDFIIITIFGKGNNLSLHDYEELLRKGKIFNKKQKSCLKFAATTLVWPKAIRVHLSKNEQKKYKHILYKYRKNNTVNI
jgi:hypothetical protein